MSFLLHLPDAKVHVKWFQCTFLAVTLFFSGICAMNGILTTKSTDLCDAFSSFMFIIVLFGVNFITFVSLFFMLIYFFCVYRNRQNIYQFSCIVIN